MYSWTIIEFWLKKKSLVTIIFTHQGVEKLIDGDEPPNPKDVGLFEVK